MAKNIITINHYTATWDDQVTQRTTLRKGRIVRIDQQPDGREYDAFSRRLKENKLTIEWNAYMPKLKMDVYKIIAAPKNYRDLATRCFNATA
jgi:methylaspartate ammonia-lyase